MTRKQIATMQLAVPQTTYLQAPEIALQERLLSEMYDAFWNTTADKIKLIDLPSIQNFSDSTIQLAAVNKIRYIILLSDFQFTSSEVRETYNSVITAHALFTMKVYDVRKKKIIDDEPVDGEGTFTYENFPMISLHPMHVANPEAGAMMEAIEAAVSSIDFNFLVPVSKWSFERREEE